MANLNEILRDHQGPPVNIEGIIRALGVQLDAKAELDPEIAGQIERLDDGEYKISVNKTDHYYRRRFTMAHELGHFLYHTHLIMEGVDDTRAYRSTSAGNYYNRHITQTEETEANRFAASILMPKELVSTIWPTCNGSVASMAKRFQVSETAMEIRLRGLHLL